MANLQHLICRDGRWYYRRRVPKALQGEFGAMIQQALGTADRKEAIRIREELDVTWRRRFDVSAPAACATNCNGDDLDNVDLDQGLAERLVRRHVETKDADNRRRFAARLMPSPEATEQVLDELHLDLAVADGSARRYDCATSLDATMSEVAGARSFDKTKSFPPEHFAKLVRRASVEIVQRSLDRWHDRHDRTFIDELFDPGRSEAVTIGELAVDFLRYAGEDALAHGVAQKHIDKTRSQIKLVTEMLGERTLVRDVGYDRCRAFCTLLSRVPANRTKIFGKLSITQATERAEKEGRATLSAISQQQYLGTLKQLLDLAVNKQLVRTNPAQNLRPLVRETVSDGERRLPFTIPQLQTFFKSAFYLSCAAHAGAPHRAAKKEWRFWLPLIALFMGMRPKEICQLHVDDVRQTDKGIWFISVEATDDRDDSDKPKKTTKTRASRRDVPLHPELISLGFLTFVDERRTGGEVCLFRGLTRNMYNDPAAYPLRRLREWMAKEIEMKPRQAFYSFRHTWADAVRVLNPPRDFLLAVGAWEQDKVTSDNYGSYSHPERYAPLMRQIVFDGLDLSHLYESAASKNLS